jgi:hypothetical protein
MGKTDVRDADAVARTHEGVRYRAFDLSEAGAGGLDRMLTDLLELFDEGALEPLPTTSFDISRAKQHSAT